MRLEMNRVELLEHLAVVATVAGKNRMNANLACVLIEASNGLRLTCSDGEVTISRQIGDEAVNVSTEGQVAIDAQRLRQILAATTAEIVRIDGARKSGVCDIDVGTCSAFTLPANEFAATTLLDLSTRKAKWKPWLAVAGEHLGVALGRVAWSVGRDNARFALGGVCFALRFGLDGLDLVTTDTRVLQVCTIAVLEAAMEAKATEPLVVTPRTCDAVRAAFTMPTPVTVETDGKGVRFFDDATTITGPLVHGRFPDYALVITRLRHHDASIEVMAGDLLACVRQAQLTMSAESAGIDLTIERDKLALESSASEIGESEVELPISDGPDEPVKVTIPGDYLRQACASVPREQMIRLEYASEDTRESHIVLGCDGWVCVIMPMVKGA